MKVDKIPSAEKAASTEREGMHQYEADRVTKINTSKLKDFNKIVRIVKIFIDTKRDNHHK